MVKNELNLKNIKIEDLLKIIKNLVDKFQIKDGYIVDIHQDNIVFLIENDENFITKVINYNPPK